MRDEYKLLQDEINQLRREISQLRDEITRLHRETNQLRDEYEQLQHHHKLIVAEGEGMKTNLNTMHLTK